MLGLGILSDTTDSCGFFLGADSINVYRITSLLLYLDLITNKLEKPVSQKYVVGKGRIRRNAISDRTGYDCKLLIQKLVTDIEEKSVFAASLVMSSMNSYCAFSGTSSTLMVNGLLAMANGVSGKLGK